MKPGDLTSAHAAFGLLPAGARSTALTLFLVFAICCGPMPQVWGSSGAGRAARTVSSSLTFVSHGHVLNFGEGKILASNGAYALQVSFQNANAVMPSSEGGMAAKDGHATALGTVTYANLWDGVNLTYRRSAGGVYESAYSIAPHADASAILLRYNAPIAINADGSLAIKFADGQLVESAPVAWQETGGLRRAVDVSFGKLGDDEVSFALGSYDSNAELYIDPTLTWNTFLGGAGTDEALDIALDGNGNIFVAGLSYASWGTPKRPFASQCDAFVAKLSPDGDLVWNTFLGGSSLDVATGVSASKAGNVYVTGYSDTTWGSPVRMFTSSVADAFVAKLDTHGALVWHTFLGGVGDDGGRSIAVDGSENVFVAGGSSASWGNPVRSFTSSSADAFVAKLSPTGSLMWNTFLGGSSTDNGYGIALDGAGNVYVAGDSGGTWGTPIRSYTNSPHDAFAARLNSSGNLVWNTFLGGLASDWATGIAVDRSGSVFVFGESASTWGSPVRSFRAGSGDAFAAKLTSNGALLWNTFLGGPTVDGSSDITVDGAGYVYVVGFSASTWGCSAPLTCTVHAYQGEIDIFGAKLEPSTGKLLWNTFLGTSGYDQGWGAAVDSNGNFYISGDSPSTWGSPVRLFTANTDGVVAKLNADIHYLTGNAGVAGATLTYTDGIKKTVTSQANGSYSLPVSYFWSGTVTPSKPGYVFVPANKTYGYVIVNKAAQNYAAYSPTGTINTLKPTYTWTKVANATQYRYETWSAGALKYTHTVGATVCGTSPVACSNLPAETLTYTAYKWHVQAFVDGNWQAYKPWVAFTIPLKPRAGLWSGMNGDLSFYVAPDQTHVKNFKAVFRNLCGLSQFTRTYLNPIVIDILTAHKFTFTSSNFNGYGIFATPSSASGKASPVCDTRLFPWSATWLNSNQP